MARKHVYLTQRDETLIEMIRVMMPSASVSQIIRRGLELIYEGAREEIECTGQPAQNGIREDIQAEVTTYQRYKPGGFLDRRLNRTKLEPIDPPVVEPDEPDDRDYNE